jgi:hypothetical protein
LENSSLKSFWACFARNRILEETTILENAALPILEVNAGFPNSVSDIAKLEQEFVVQGKSGILILSDDPKLELAASNAQFLPYSSLVLLEVQSEANDLIVEQVSWTQASTLARVWCLQHQALDWTEFVAKEIARGMQQSSKLTAYLAFENHEPTGMMFALEPGFTAWMAGETRALQALTNRLSSDFEQAIVAVPIEQISFFPEAREIARLSVWLKLR